MKEIQLYNRGMYHLMCINFIWMLLISSAGIYGVMTYYIDDWVEWPKFVIIGLIVISFVYRILIYPFLYKKYTYFNVFNQMMKMQTGAFSVHEQHTPLDRIQEVREYQSFIQKMFHVKNVEIFTAGTELKIKSIDEAAADEMVENVMSYVKGVMSDV